MGGKNAKKADLRGFTLTEMIFVVGIVLLILTAMGPALFNSIGAGGVATGAREIAGVFTTARSEAVRFQTLTRVAILSAPRAGDGRLRVKGAYRKMAIFKMDDPDTQEWVQISGWYELPEGLILEPEMPAYVKGCAYAEHDASLVDGAYPLSQREEEPEDQFLVNTPQGEDLPTEFVEFLPTGGVRASGEQASKCMFVVVQGHEKSPGTGRITRTAPRDPEVSDPQNNGARNTTNWAQVNIINLTGNVKVYRP